MMEPGRQPAPFRYRYYLAAVVGILFLLLVVGIAPLVVGLESFSNEEPIRVGVLHSLTGTMAFSEKPVADATLFAIDQLNKHGGVLGRRVEPIVIDGRSDWDTFARGAETLITQDKVSAVFGCWTSACRRTVKPVFERLGAVLFYPVQYEGLEQSPNIIYTGAAPNQQILPATKWSIDHLGRRIYLVGSDYVFPRTANAILHIQIGTLNGEVVGESYRPLGDTDFAAIAADIKRVHPDVVFNTINGDSNIAFYHAIRAAGIKSSDIPVMSFSIAEAEVKAIGPALVAGDYACRNYFMSVDTPTNHDFIREYRQMYGQDKVTSAPMEAAWFGVMLWAKAVEEAGSTNAAEWKPTLLGQSMTAPAGTIYVEPTNQHVWRTVMIGHAQPDGNFDIVWSSHRPIRPVPYPSFLPRSQWDAFLNKMYVGWGNHWSAPVPGSP